MEKLIQKYATRDDLPLLEAARLGMLPDQLKAWHIAWLYFPEKADEPKRKIFCNALNEAATKGDLKAELKDKKRTVRIAMKINGRPINPNARDEYETVHYYVVRRDAYKAFLQANGEWPPTAGTLIANWYATEIPQPEIAREAPKKKAPAPNELHQLIEKVYLTARPKLKRAPNADEILSILKERRAEFDTNKIITEIKGNSIHWNPTDGTLGKPMGRKALQNLISELNKKHKKQRVVK